LHFLILQTGYDEVTFNEKKMLLVYF